jgi:predicted dehydrogenase
MAKYEALLIGCGNIGALYDFDDYLGKVLTHAKAYYLLRNKINLTITDLNLDLINKVSLKYKFKSTLINEIDYSKYEIVSLTTPTDTHFNYLKTILQNNVPLVICEKPISLSKIELYELEELKKKSKSKIIVNYSRRFNTFYEELKDYFEENQAILKIKHINIRYCRGFLNNCSHALDLINFLFSIDMTLENFKIIEKEYDTFQKDPTISAVYNEKDFSINIKGFTNLSYFIFEIDFFFTDMKIKIKNLGNEIRIYEFNKISKEFDCVSNMSFNNVLKISMFDVLNKSIDILENDELFDNYRESVNLNINMLNVLN